MAKRIKTPEILNYVRELYELENLGYWKIAQRLYYDKDIRVSWKTVRNWIKELGLETHEAKKFKEYGPTWYKKEYSKLKEQVNKLEQENMELKNALDKMELLELKIEELKAARERDQEIINMLFRTIAEECNHSTIKEAINQYNKAMGFS